MTSAPEEHRLIRNKVVLVEGRKNQILSFTTNLAEPRLRPSKTIYVLDDEDQRTAIKERLAIYGFSAEILDYGSLTGTSARRFRGKSIVLCSPLEALNQGDAPGRIDGALIRVLAARSRGLVIVTSEGKGNLETSEVADIGEVARWLSQRLAFPLEPETWLNELLLELLYERHVHFAEIKRLVANSVWWHSGAREAHSIQEALLGLSKKALASEERGRYFTSTELGRLVVEGRKSIGRSNLYQLQNIAGANRQELEPPEYDMERQRLAYVDELALNLVVANGWTTVNGLAEEASRAHVTKTPSRWLARRHLESLVREGTLTRTPYQRGGRGPMFVYYARGSSKAADIFENRCGDCAFYARVVRRCRLWWSLSRFNAAETWSRKDELSVVARDKFANANIRVGPNATACDYFAPRKREFPLTKARDNCLGCGKEIEAPVAKLVRCATCGTSYKPSATKILVSYNYENILRDRYWQISGANPPSQAVVLSGQEFAGRTDWRDVIVLYPHETVRLAMDGIYLSKEERGMTFQRYENIYQIVDYGALGSNETAELNRRGIRVVQKSLRFGGSDFPVGLYPSQGFVENLRVLSENREFRRRFSESLLLSVIIATKRIADQGGKPLRILVNRQLLEYDRMLKDQELTVTRALAFEARVNNLYWTAYKKMLQYPGLDFKSRVRDRFVREFVSNARARARGYSPANAAINYLHQRRLMKCRVANAEAGIGWIGCEGIFHTAKRRPSIGLLLDLSDSFRLADREALLMESIGFKISREDFVARLGKHRLWFFFPSMEGVEKLEDTGSNADRIQVNCHNGELPLIEAYKEFVKSFVDAVNMRDVGLFRPFIYGNREDLYWLETYTT